MAVSAGSARLRFTWDVGITNFGMNTTDEVIDGVITKMRKADSAFPRVNLAKQKIVAVSITNHRRSEVVHTPN